MKRIVLFLVCLLFMAVSVYAVEEVMEDVTIVLDTTQGPIEIKLFPELAPKACENFAALVKDNYYDGIIFHRIIKGFMIQGGDPTGTGRGGNSVWGGPFEDEIDTHLKFDKEGILAMANAGPNTNGSQFFITTAPAPWLDGRHTIFGEVISGYENVEDLEDQPTGAQDKPIVEQKIIKAYIK